MSLFRPDMTSRANRVIRLTLRTFHAVLCVLGLLTLLVLAIQFTPWPWRAIRVLSEIPAASSAEPTHLLLMGGSGIPGESGLIRIWYAADAAARFPSAQVWVAMPQNATASPATAAYLDELRRRGVAPERITVLDGGENTREQALRLVERLAKDRSPKAVCIGIITSPEHIRRTAASIRRAARDRGNIVALTAFPAFPLSLDDPHPAFEVPMLNTTDASSAAPAKPASAASEKASLFSLLFRYSLWGHLKYTLDASREAVALAVYRLRGWI